MATFEVGKVYKHPSGEIMHIVGAVKTTQHGWCLVGESSHRSDLKPVGQGDVHATGWKEISLDIWHAIFSDGGG